MNYFENQWVEVFRVGEHTDSAGKIRKWTGDNLREIARKYNAKKHEAPVVIGHPKDNAPAFGWVDSLKTDGETLFARFKQLVPEFLEAVKKGFYKKRSISIYPDLTLRHVGFLGAVPPAIKGLADISFSENESITIETEVKELNFMALQETEKDRKINELKEQLRREQQKNRRAEFKEFVNRLHSEGKIVSDLKDTVIDLMEILNEAEQENYSEDGISSLELFQDYLSKQPPIVEFGESVQEDIVRQSKASEQINLLTMERARKNNITFSEALGLVQAENPDLAEQAAQEV